MDDANPDRIASSTSIQLSNQRDVSVEERQSFQSFTSQGRTPSARKYTEDESQSFAPSIVMMPEASFSQLPTQPLMFTWNGVWYWVPVEKPTKSSRRLPWRRAKATEANDVEKQLPSTDSERDEISLPRQHGEDEHLESDDGSMMALLRGVSGFSQPGRLTALCGSSGAGKSTLLDVLADRKTKGRIEGEIRYNGEIVDYSFLVHFMGYVEQRDLHMSKQTVYEAVVFAARTRLPPDTTDETAVAFANHILDVMNLRSDRNRLVGSESESGMSGFVSNDARKRLSLAVEYAANASLYFLDEPTSGLDARSALRVTRAIRAMANNGRSVVAVIHQPSYEVFSAFDSLLLMQRGGRTVYFGELGNACTTMTSYFESHGAEPIDTNTNPADYMLRVIGAGVTAQRAENVKDWVEIWNASPECKHSDAMLEELNTSSRGAYKLEYTPPTRKQEWTRTYHVIIRQLISYWRTPNYNFSRFVLAIFLGLID